MTFQPATSLLPVATGNGGRRDQDSAPLAGPDYAGGRMNKGTAVADEINDDVFEYDNSDMTQCISGFGRNFYDCLSVDLHEFNNAGADERTDVKERAKWHISQLVGWCRHFNRKSQEQARTIAILEGQLAMAEDMAREHRGESKAPAIIRRAMDLCETCRGLPELSIGRCPMCRELATVL